MRQHKRALQDPLRSPRLHAPYDRLAFINGELETRRATYGNLVALALQGVGYRTPIERTDRKDGTFEVNRRALTFDV